MIEPVKAGDPYKILKEGADFLRKIKPAKIPHSFMVDGKIYNTATITPDEIKELRSKGLFTE